MPDAPDPGLAQRERALQAWELVVTERLDDARLEVLRRVVRVKRFELGALRARLPGAVRRGARVDLEPLARALDARGIPCALRRRDSAVSPETG